MCILTSRPCLHVSVSRARPCIMEKENVPSFCSCLYVQIVTPTLTECVCSMLVCGQGCRQEDCKCLWLCSLLLDCPLRHHCVKTDAVLFQKSQPIVVRDWRTSKHKSQRILEYASLGIHGTQVCGYFGISNSLASQWLFVASEATVVTHF